MCKPKSPPPPSPPAPAPAPPAPAATVAQADPASASGDTNQSLDDRVRRQGRNALRIPLTQTDNTGLNIPVT